MECTTAAKPDCSSAFQRMKMPQQVEDSRSCSGYFQTRQIGRVGIEPTRSPDRRILSPLRIPFRHRPAGKPICNYSGQLKSPGHFVPGVGLRRHPSCMHHEKGRRRPTSGRRPKKGDASGEPSAWPFQSPLNSYADFSITPLGCQSRKRQLVAHRSASGTVFEAAFHLDLLSSNAAWL